VHVEAEVAQLAHGAVQDSHCDPSANVVPGHAATQPWSKSSPLEQAVHCDTVPVQVVQGDSHNRQSLSVADWTDPLGHDGRHWPSYSTRPDEQLVHVDAVVLQLVQGESHCVQIEPTASVPEGHVETHDVSLRNWPEGHDVQVVASVMQFWQPDAHWSQVLLVVLAK